MITLREKLNDLPPERRCKIEGMVKELVEEMKTQSTNGAESKSVSDRKTADQT